MREDSQNSSAKTLSARYRNPSERPQIQGRLRNNDGNVFGRDRPRSRGRSHGIEESYCNTYSSYKTWEKHRYHSHDTWRSSSMKRGRNSESSLSRVSKTGTSEEGHEKSKPKRRKPTDEEDLTVPWSCEDVDPFTPQKARMTNNVNTYYGTGDPKDHVKIFQAAAQLERWAIPTWCHMFNSTLIGTARQKKYVKDSVEIHNIKQKDGETIEEFMERFKIETGRMKGAPECMRIFGFMHGSLKLIKRLNEHVPKTLEEMMTATLRKQIEELPSDMTRVPRSIAEHRLNIREGYSPVGQKTGAAPERAKAIQVEHDGSWRMCADFTDLNKACPQDCYPLLEIDWKVKSLCGYPFKCFLDAYKGYHQIQMTEQDEKSRPSTLVTRQISRNLEIYVDDLVIKSHMETELLRDIEETFCTLQKINMKLNPKKCMFRAAEGMFLGYMINPEGIKLCPDKTKAVLQLPSLRTIKEILANFLVKKPDDSPPEVSVIETPQEPWTLFTNGSSCVDGLGAGLILRSSAGTEFTYALSFAHLSKQVLVEVLKKKSMQEEEVATIVEEEGSTWMTPIMEYLKDGTLFNDRKEASKLRIKARQYELWEGVLYRRSFLKPWLRKGQVFDNCYELFHKVDRSKSRGNNHRRSEVVIPVKIKMSTYRKAVVDVIQNNEELRLNLDLLEEWRECAAICEAKEKVKMIKYYNTWVRDVTFRPGDFVYRSNEASHAMDGGKLGPKWEGPYEVTEALGDGVYRLRSKDGGVFLRTWNVANLKKCYLWETAWNNSHYN
nr:reverse transcriptase domain-containing protein [Tanacetum cinerariifolium]